MTTITGPQTTYTYEADSAVDSMAHDFYGTVDPTLTYTFDYNLANQVSARAVSDAGFMYSHDAEKNEGYEAEGDASKAANGLNQYGVIRQNGPGGVVSYTLTYDDNGSLTGDGTWSYAYDVENRLTCAQENGAGPVSWISGSCVFGASSSKRAVYGYDPIGRRFRKCVVLVPGSGDPCADVLDAVITEFTSDGVEEVQDVDGMTNAVLMEYVHGPGVDEIAFYADRVNGGSFYPITDHLGSVVALQQRNVSSMAEAFHYTAYGEIAAGEESGYPFRFTGRRYDAETGLYYYRARYYNPILGRFYQTDPIGYGDNMNMYAYVGNDPVNGRDPTGEAGTCGRGKTCPDGVKLSPLDKKAESLRNRPKAIDQANSLLQATGSGALEEPSRDVVEIVASKTVELLGVPGKITASSANVITEVENGVPLDEAIAGETAAVSATFAVTASVTAAAAETGPFAPVIGILAGEVFDVAGGADVARELAKEQLREFKEDDPPE